MMWLVQFSGTVQQIDTSPPGGIETYHEEQIPFTNRNRDFLRLQ